MDLSPIYEIQHKIGNGAYGEVYLAWDLQRKCQIAVKKFSQESETIDGCDTSILREIINLQRSKHENVVELLNVHCREVNDKQKYYLVFPYYQQDLFSFLKTVIHNKEKLHLNQIKRFFTQILRGLQHIHNQGILHRDLKPTNILLTNDLQVKIADFGLSRSLGIQNQSGELTYEVITQSYRPPELLLGQTNYNWQVDIWSVACIFIEVSTLYTFFYDETQLGVLKQQFKLFGIPNEKDYPSLTKLPLFNKLSYTEERGRSKQFENILCKAIGKEGHDLVSRMLQMEAFKRISCTQALDHPFLK